MTSASQSSVLQVAPAPRGALQGHVYRQLCELILNGEIAPGQLITMWPAANRGRLQGACVAARRRNQVESKFRSGKANDCVVSRVPATRRRSLIALELLGRLVISAPSGRRPPLECHLKCANGSTVSTARCSRRRSQAFSSTDAKVARENGVGTSPDLASAGGVVAPSAVADELCDRDVAGDVRAGCVLEFKLAAAARLHQIVYRATPSTTVARSLPSACVPSSKPRKPISVASRGMLGRHSLPAGPWKAARREAPRLRG